MGQVSNAISLDSVDESVRLTSEDVLSILFSFTLAIHSWNRVGKLPRCSFCSLSRAESKRQRKLRFPSGAVHWSQICHARTFSMNHFPIPSIGSQLTFKIRYLPIVCFALVQSHVLSFFHVENVEFLPQTTRFFTSRSAMSSSNELRHWSRCASSMGGRIASHDSTPHFSLFLAIRSIPSIFLWIIL